MRKTYRFWQFHITIGCEQFHFATFTLASEVYAPRNNIGIPFLSLCLSCRLSISLSTSHNVKTLIRDVLSGWYELSDTRSSGDGREILFTGFLCSGVVLTGV